ncbi:MAG: hypothetical protein EOO43_16695 [Flavobacterium sp.]|nr:MAG: hypothetical protein EOO43_16695 [Flavobacterium sp.]
MKKRILGVCLGLGLIAICSLSIEQVHAQNTLIKDLSPDPGTITCPSGDNQMCFRVGTNGMVWKGSTSTGVSF